MRFLGKRSIFILFLRYNFLLLFKRATAIFLLLIFFCQSLNRLVVYAGFYANQRFIEQYLCENRDRPMMHCNGHCQLNKKLADDDKQNAQTPAQKSADEMSDFFIHSAAVQPTVFIEKVAKPFCAEYRPLHLQTFTRSAFHPPDA